MKLMDYALCYDSSKTNVYVVGGVDCDTAEESKRVFKYDFKNRKWSEFPEMLEARK